MEKEAMIVKIIKSVPGVMVKVKPLIIFIWGQV